MVDWEALSLQTSFACRSSVHHSAALPEELTNEVLNAPYR